MHNVKLSVDLEVQVKEGYTILQTDYSISWR